MHIGVPAETRANEARVAATPESKRRTRPMLGVQDVSLRPDHSGRHRSHAHDRQRTDEVCSRNPPYCR
jgi:hypothetical protein